MSAETSCTCDLLNAVCPLHRARSPVFLRIKEVLDEEKRLRDTRIILAASRGVLTALRTTLSLGLAAKSFNYGERTLEGDTFETAFEWAREEVKDG